MTRNGVGESNWLTGSWNGGDVERERNEVGRYMVFIRRPDTELECSAQTTSQRRELKVPKLNRAVGDGARYLWFSFRIGGSPECGIEMVRGSPNVQRSGYRTELEMGGL